MINFNEILEQNKNGVLATQSENQIYTRVFQCLFCDENKIYFSTNNRKSVYKQMISNPNVSFCTYNENFDPVISINGEAVFIDDKSLKIKILDENPNIKEIFKVPENPVFEMFYIDIKEVKTYTFEEGTKNYNM